MEAWYWWYDIFKRVDWLYKEITIHIWLICLVFKGYFLCGLLKVWLPNFQSKIDLFFKAIYLIKYLCGSYFVYFKRGFFGSLKDRSTGMYLLVKLQKKAFTSLILLLFGFLGSLLVQERIIRAKISKLKGIISWLYTQVSNLSIAYFILESPIKLNVFIQTSVFGRCFGVNALDFLYKL